MLIVAFILIVVLIGIDQFIKVLVDTNMNLFEQIHVIKFGSHEIFNLRYVVNDGASWSIFSGRRWFLLIITIIAMAFAFIYLVKYAKAKPAIISISLIIAGGIGNMIDRIFRDGKVIDYIETGFMNFPIFNFADICIVIGVFIFAIYYIFFEEKNKKKSETEKNNAE